MPTSWWLWVYTAQHDTSQSPSYAPPWKHKIWRILRRTFLWIFNKIYRKPYHPEMHAGDVWRRSDEVLGLRFNTVDKVVYLLRLKNATDTNEFAKACHVLSQWAKSGSPPQCHSRLLITATLVSKLDHYWNYIYLDFYQPPWANMRFVFGHLFKGCKK
jgi:hypothetical protein